MSQRRIGRLHVLTPAHGGRLGPVAFARLVAGAGAEVVQLRDKRAMSSDERMRTARAMRAALAGCGATLLVNDHVDVARAAGAGGVHLGRSDEDPRRARAILGAVAWIGVTANNLDEARRAAALPVDYLGVGPVFGTTSKDDPAPALGLAGLERIARAIDLPVIAIGNLTPERVADVLRAGAHGVAVLSAIAHSTDPAGETARFVEALARAGAEPALAAERRHG